MKVLSFATRERVCLPLITSHAPPPTHADIHTHVRARAPTQVEKPICVEDFQTLAAMGRFTLRDEGKTIAIGKVTKLPKEARGGA